MTRLRHQHLPITPTAVCPSAAIDCSVRAAPPPSATLSSAPRSGGALSKTSTCAHTDGSNPVIGNADRSLDSSDDEDNEDIDPEGKGKEKEGEDKGKEKEDEAERKKAEEEEEERNRQGLELPVRGEQDKAKAGETDKADGTLNKSDQEATLGNADRGRGKRTARTEGDEEEVDEDALRERLFNLWATMDPHSLQGMRYDSASRPPLQRARARAHADIHVSLQGGTIQTGQDLPCPGFAGRARQIGQGQGKEQSRCGRWVQGRQRGQ